MYPRNNEKTTNLSEQSFVTYYPTPARENGLFRCACILSFTSTVVMWRSVRWRKSGSNYGGVALSPYCLFLPTLRPFYVDRGVLGETDLYMYWLVSQFSNQFMSQFISQLCWIINIHIHNWSEWSIYSGYIFIKYNGIFDCTSEEPKCLQFSFVR